jgi:hypothetical protein
MRQRSPKDAAIEAFLSGRSRILVMSLRSGVGVDGLQAAAKVCVFGELDWSPQVHDQGIGRLRRDGQEDESVIAYYLVSDEGWRAAVLNLKRNQSEPMLNPLAATVIPTGDNRDRIRKLAAAILQQAGVPAIDDSAA